MSETFRFKPLSRDDLTDWVNYQGYVLTGKLQRDEGLITSLRDLIGAYKIKIYDMQDDEILPILPHPWEAKSFGRDRTHLTAVAPPLGIVARRYPDPNQAELVFKCWETIASSATVLERRTFTLLYPVGLLGDTVIFPYFEHERSQEGNNAGYLLKDTLKRRYIDLPIELGHQPLSLLNFRVPRILWKKKEDGKYLDYFLTPFDDSYLEIQDALNLLRRKSKS